MLATDVLWLSGRTDVEVPPIGGEVSSFPIVRTEPGPVQQLETSPGSIAVTPGEELRFDAVGLARFAPLAARPGPDGDEGKRIDPVGGISGYEGPGGALAGVFLDDAIPLGGAPASLDFSATGLGTDFEHLAPGLGQAFFIGDGLTGTADGVRQRFTVPDGATRLFLGSVDADSTDGPAIPPGFYTDNAGRYLVTRVAPATEVLGTDAISLAGRTDIVIPPLDGDPGAFPLQRFPDPTGNLETFPLSHEVTPGERVSFYAHGDAVFSPGGAPPGPEGDALKAVLPVGGISGYTGPGGSLVGVFLDDEIPIGDPPASLDFSPYGSGTEVRRIQPALRQIFYIGNGATSGGARRSFDAPEGATRLLLGTMDGEGFYAPPGFYTDNTGSFSVEFVPEPSAGALALASASCLAALASRRSRSRRR